ncbi:MAG: LamG domain-containing protein [Dehalococcoidia bacterium]|nr:MAG: LamG domain-containing protein [Dehalococcoidia bacterium]
MANNFASDPNCVGLWKFDNNANDSKGGNHLTPVNAPTYDAVNKKEGTHSIDFEADSSQYCVIADASLDAGFPGKSGTSEQSFSIVGWIRPESLNGSQGIVKKYVTTGDKRSYQVLINVDYIRFHIGYNAGVDFTYLNHSGTLVAGRWYHFAVTYDHTTNGMKIRVWDDYNSQLLAANATTTAAGDMSPRDARLDMGYVDCDGKLDEVAIFKDVLTDDEIDAIRAGTYSAVVTAHKDAATRFLLHAQAYQDIATRFKTGIRNYEDAATRFLLGLPYYKDITSRFRLWSQAFQDVATRFKLGVQGYKDTATRFRFTAQSYKDAAARFILHVQAYQDTTTRFRLILQPFVDVATRFRLLPLVQHKDVSTRFFLYQPTWKSLQILKDIAALEATVAGLERRPRAHFEI